MALAICNKGEKNIMYYIFSFRSRVESMNFFDDLKSDGIFARLVSTPRSISIGCGLSVKIPPCVLEKAQIILSRCTYKTLLGLYYYNGLEFVKV